MNTSATTAKMPILKDSFFLKKTKINNEMTNATKTVLTLVKSIINKSNPDNTISQGCLVIVYRKQNHKSRKPKKYAAICGNLNRPLR
jgi:hypothetical protein